MNFQLIKSDPTLTKLTNQGGCGLSQRQVNGIVREQGSGDYYFSMHTGYHGMGARHYIYVHDGTPPKKNMGRIFINTREVDGNFGSLKNRHIRDAQEVVRDNEALFLTIIANITA
ncbi:MAG TPA: hypothetical protein VGB73_02920 [Pyrinomonadaceae bacterium]